MFTLIFVGLFLAAWLFLAFVPWLAVSVFTRGNAGLGNLPLCLFAGVVAALAIPVLGMEDERGIWLSMVAALVAPALLLAVRRMTFVSLNNPVAGESETK